MGFELDNSYSQRSLLGGSPEAVPLPDPSVLQTPGAQKILSKEKSQLAPPDFWSGSLEAVGSGLATGAVETVKAGAVIGAGLVAQTGLLDTESTDTAFKTIDEISSSLLTPITPDAEQLGTGAQILGGFAEMVAPLTLGGVAGYATGVSLAATTLAATQGVKQGTQLTQQGVDKTTASLSAGLEAGLVYAGANVPIYGSNLPTKALSGAVGNVGAGVVYRAAQGSLLDAAGYNELAKQYSPFDAANLSIDALMGALFGLLPKTSPLDEVNLSIDDLRGVLSGLRREFRRDQPQGLPQRVQGATSEEQASVARAANQKHAATDSAPGKPTTSKASAAHASAMHTAADQVHAGEPVDVSQAAEQFKDAEFEITPEKLDAMEAAKAEIEKIYQEEVQEDFPQEDILKGEEKVYAPADATTSQDAALSQAMAEKSSVDLQVEKTLKELEETVEQEKNLQDKEVSLSVRMVQDWIKDHGDFEIHLTDAAETEQKISVTEAFKQADKEISNAKKMGQAVIALAKCTLINGSR